MFTRRLNNSIHQLKDFFMEQITGFFRFTGIISLLAFLGLYSMRTNDRSFILLIISICSFSMIIVLNLFKYYLIIKRRKDHS